MSKNWTFLFPTFKLSNFVTQGVALLLTRKFASMGRPLLDSDNPWPAGVDCQLNLKSICCFKSKNLLNNYLALSWPISVTETYGQWQPEIFHSKQENFTAHIRDDMTGTSSWLMTHLKILELSNLETESDEWLKR